VTTVKVLLVDDPIVFLEALQNLLAVHPLQARELVAHVGVAPLVNESRGDIHFC
jgi:hypothetical protein